MKHQGKIQDISIHKTDRPSSVGDDATRPDPEVREKKPKSILHIHGIKQASMDQTVAWIVEHDSNKRLCL